MAQIFPDFSISSSLENSSLNTFKNTLENTLENSNNKMRKSSKPLSKAFTNEKTAFGHSMAELRAQQARIDAIKAEPVLRLSTPKKKRAARARRVPNRPRYGPRPYETLENYNRNVQYSLEYMRKDYANAINERGHGNSGVGGQGIGSVGQEIEEDYNEEAEDETDASNNQPRYPRYSQTRHSTRLKTVVSVKLIQAFRHDGYVCVITVEAGSGSSVKTSTFETKQFPPLIAEKEDPITRMEEHYEYLGWSADSLE